MAGRAHFRREELSFGVLGHGSFRYELDAGADDVQLLSQSPARKVEWGAQHAAHRCCLGLRFPVLSSFVSSRDGVPASAHLRASAGSEFGPVWQLESQTFGTTCAGLATAGQSGDRLGWP